MKCPSIKKFYKLEDFLRDIFRLNKEERKSFSHRVFAKRAKWPISYLADVLSGRKKLTIARALQLAQALRLSSADTEYLVTMCLSSSENESVSSHFKLLLTQRNLPKELQLPLGVLADRWKSLPDFKALYLRELLIWGKGLFPLKELVKLQVAYPELGEKRVLSETLAALIERELIIETKKGYYADQGGDFFSLDEEVFYKQNTAAIGNLHIKSLEILMRLYQCYSGRGLSFSSFLQVPTERLPEMIKKFSELRDWIISVSKEAPKLKPDQVEIFQFELHGLPMIKR